jgi:hypothetical protein
MLGSVQLATPTRSRAPLGADSSETDSRVVGSVDHGGTIDETLV